MSLRLVADLELLNTLLNDINVFPENLKGSLSEAKMDQETRAKRNAELRQRMNEMKKSSSNALGAVMAKMMQMMGQDPKDLLTEEQINRILDKTFTKFDKDGSGIHEKPEFFKAWEL